MNQLGFFYGNQVMREEVKTFLLTSLDEIALEKMYARKETGGIADAKDAIENAFIKLEETYKKVEKPNIENKAR